MSRRLLLLCLWLCAPSCLWAAVLNVEFQFTPYRGDPAADSVDTVAGRARVYLNGVPLLEQAIAAQSVPVMFEAREIAPALWLPASAFGPGLRRGENSLRIEFEPADAAAYSAQLRWAEVTDAVQEERSDGHYAATNQSGEGQETRQGHGPLSFERRFVADFASDRPFHHYPPVDALSAADRAAILEQVQARAAAFRPTFDGVHQLLAGRENLRLADIKRLKCLDKAYAAGLRIVLPPVESIELLAFGRPEVVVRGRDGAPLFMPNDAARFERIKGQAVQLCAGVALAAAYPPQLVFVRTPAGRWEVAY